MRVALGDSNETTEFVDAIKLRHVATFAEPKKSQRQSEPIQWLVKTETVNSTQMKVADRTENEPMKSDESSTKRNIFTRLTPIAGDTGSKKYARR